MGVLSPTCMVYFPCFGLVWLDVIFVYLKYHSTLSFNQSASTNTFDLLFKDFLFFLSGIEFALKPNNGML